MNKSLHLPSLEDGVLEYWRKHNIVQRFATRNKDGERWVTYEGPPTVNGSPALHHVWTSTYKDVYGRFHTLRGKRIDRKGGWDCQGLPVEIAVERKLGLKNKRQIEEYGVAAFVAECRSMVEQNIAIFERVLSRFSYWVDYEKAYRTMDDQFIESVWWHISKMWAENLLYEGRKVVPYCVRCATALSSHELGQPNVYKETSHEAAFVAVHLVDSTDELVVWTTTPWTLPANVAIAVNPTLTYGRYQSGSRTIILAVSRAAAVEPSARLIEQFPGVQLIGRTYQRPYSSIEMPEGRDSVVVGAEDVTEDVGTGLLHVAPAFGEQDAMIGSREGLSILNPIDSNGLYRVGPFVGLSALEASPDVIADLRDRSLLLRSEQYSHQYPHCWRCQSPLIYWAKPTWFIATSQQKDQLIKENERITWYPDHLKYGRFGNWLQENVDWAVSRDRFWGTPLPIWRCPSGHDTCISSRDDLSRLTGKDQSIVSLHRPEIDDVTFPCPECGEEAVRDPAVCDVWLDSGCVPAAQWWYPKYHQDEFKSNFPADFVCEALDQTRGWFYSMLAANTLVFGETPFKNVVCLGLLVDDEGRKMSKSVGNVIDPLALLPNYGADGVRWYLLTSGQPWGTKRISFDAIEQRIRRDLDTLWNVVVFYSGYAKLEQFSPGGHGTGDQVLDRWILSRLTGLTQSITMDMEEYGAHRAVQDISAFIDDLSNWYVRRSRRRFWGSDPTAFETLNTVLRTLAVLLSPFCPFLAEAVFQEVNELNAASVHLATWPTINPALRDPVLEAEMADARKVSALARSARSDAGIPVRQPLSTAVVTGIGDWSESVRYVVEEEANVRQLVVGAEARLPIKYRLQPNWKKLGPRHRDIATELARAITASEDEDLIDRLRSGTATFIKVDGREVEIQPDEVEVAEIRLEGWQIASEGGVAIALETALSDELIREGRRRTLVRHIQVARRENGFDVRDRIQLWVVDDLVTDGDLIANEVLAITVEPLKEAPLDIDLIRGEGFAMHRT